MFSSLTEYLFFPLLSPSHPSPPCLKPSHPSLPHASSPCLKPSPCSSPCLKPMPSPCLKPMPQAHPSLPQPSLSPMPQVQPSLFPLIPDYRKSCVFLFSCFLGNLLQKKRNRRLRWNRSEILSRTSARARSGEPSRPRSRKISIFDFFNAEHGQSVATARSAPKFYPSNTCLGRSGAFCRPHSRRISIFGGGRGWQNCQNPHAAAAAVAAAAAHDELWSAQTLPPLPRTQE